MSGAESIIGILIISVAVWTLVRSFSSASKSEHQTKQIGRQSPAAGKNRVQQPVRPAQGIVEGTCHVVDGDTIIINRIRIRLFGIDAPEIEHPYGKKAKWALVNLVKGKRIKAKLEGSASYDRAVAKCFLPDGTDLSAEMVKIGHAVDWPKFSGGIYSHLEVDGIRKRLWRCDARQKGRLFETLPD